MRFKAWIVLGKHGRPAAESANFARRAPIFFEHGDAADQAERYNKCTGRKPAQPYRVVAVTVEHEDAKTGPKEKPATKRKARSGPPAKKPAAPPESATKPGPGLFGKGKKQ